MSETSLELLKYPNGKFTRGLSYTFSETKKNIEEFKAFPVKLDSLVKNWDDKILSVSYREGGWNARQIINHLADSHAQLLLRFKSTLTEEKPEVRPYLQDEWANLYDGLNSPIQPSLQIISGIHARLVFLFNTLSESDWQKTIYHPESKHTFTLAELLALYVWHGNQHYGHLKIIQSKK
ncbi:MAG: putative metal-dependent hydrolase [Bacteroidia bacterium]|nr:putative metal-dependent hydrolase [Bacteroidia bacterium]